MNRQQLEQMARLVATGELSVADFMDRLEPPGMASLGEATLDLDRQRRCGYPEVVFGSGKTVETLAKIFLRLLEADADVLATRVDPAKANELLIRFPSGRYNSLAQTFRLDCPQPVRPRRRGEGHVVVVTAGTSDLPVSEEARETLDWMGVPVTMIHDVGVAGPHRLPAHLDTLLKADVVVVVAGMEGALPSVVGGYVACPVVAVPTSVGYGANFGGLAALLGMLNSCAANVTVVNIDAGFKGGYVAGLIADRGRRTETKDSETQPK
jgi:NCAIR mutase (PurE)-related protein